MNLNPSEDQQAIVAAVREQMEAESARDWGISKEGPPRLPDRLWASCAGMGWLGLGVDEASGGVGYGMPEEVLLFREIGRYLMPGPFLGTVIAAHVAVAAGDLELAESLIGGSQRVGWCAGAYALDADPDDLIVAIADGVVTVSEVESAEPRPSVDPSIGLARIGTSNRVVAAQDGRLGDLARLLISAQMLGIAEAVRDQSAEYARQRQQFGNPIGVYQAIKHRCADQAVRCWSTRAQLFLSALLLDAQRSEAKLATASTVMLARNAAWENTAANVHIHGGLGVTAEHTAGNYVKRTQVLDRSLGDLDAVVIDLLRVEREAVQQ